MPDTQLSTASVLDAYRLIRKLGQGGMGVVWLAYDPALDRHVAIKQLRNPQPANTVLLQRLLREARAAARLNHPNTVTIYQTATRDDQTYIVMEYLDGGSLADHLLQHGAMPWRQAAQAIRDAAAGLQAAHEAGIIHRDIKPANLIRTQRGLVKLVDFGLARCLDFQSELTHPGAFVGSPAYVSPEQAQANPSVPVDARSDIYSLICTFYALLTRRPPFVDEDAAVILRRHIHDPFPDPRREVPGLELPDSICRILAKGGEKNPRARYASAADLLRDLESALATPEQSHTFGAAWAAAPSDPSSAPASAPDLAALESDLTAAQSTGTLADQSAAWRRLFLAYRHAQRETDAQYAFRQALALHLRAQIPTARS